MSVIETKEKEFLQDDATDVSAETETVCSEEVVTETELLQKRLQLKEVEVEEADNRLKRLQADFDNFRKRTQTEKSELSYLVKGDLIKSILPVLDNCERAFGGEIPAEAQAFAEGFQLIYKQLYKILEDNGMERIEAKGKEFDPNYHEAIMRAPSEEFENDIISEEFQTGYMVGGRTVRPAMVKVTYND